MTEWERKKAHEDLCGLIQSKQQKDRVNKKSIEERIKDIRKKWPIGIKDT